MRTPLVVKYVLSYSVFDSTGQGYCIIHQSITITEGFEPSVYMLHTILEGDAISRMGYGRSVYSESSFTATEDFISAVSEVCLPVQMKGVDLLKINQRLF